MESIQTMIEGFEAATGEKILSVTGHLYKFKVITLWQPWASLLVHAIKLNETRPKPTSWVTSHNFLSHEKGHYLIHAAQKWGKEQESICLQEPFRHELEKLGLMDFGGYSPSFKKHYRFFLPLGAIIGTVDFEKCCKIIGGEKLHYFDGYHKDLSHKITFVQHPEVDYGDYTNGRFVWIGKNHRVLAEPIPYKNGQGYYLDFKGGKSKLIFK